MHYHNTNKNGEIVIESASWTNHSLSYVDGLEEIFEGGSFSATNGGSYHYLFEAEHSNGVAYYSESTDDTLAPDQTITLEHDGWIETDWGTNGYEDYTNAGTFDIAQEEGGWGESHTNGMLLELNKASKVKMVLHTGGTGVIGQQVLAAISASATQEIYPGYYSGTNIPSVQINIPGLGKNLGTDGWAYGTVNNGDPVDVTPTVSGVPMYSFTVGGGAHLLTITANGTALDPDTVVDDAYFCVGQRMTFDVNGLPGLTDAVAYWKLPDTFVNETNSSCPLFCDENPNLLVNDLVVNGTLSTSCWYVKGLHPGIASVNLQLYFSNGQNVHANASGKFDMYRPTASFKPTPFGTPNVMVTNGILVLRHPQMTFRHKIHSIGFSGQAAYTQLVSGSYTSTFGNLVEIAPNGGTGTPDTELDNMTPTRGPFSVSAYTNSPAAFWDAPENGLHQGNASMNVDFSTYLMFKPDVWPGPNIYVPLRLVSWTLNAEANNGVGTGNATITSEGDCTTFPLWTNTFVNSGF